MFLEEGKKIGIRNLETNDTELFVNWWNDGKLMESVGFKNGLGIKHERLAKIFQDQIDDHTPNRVARMYVICELDSLKPIGELNYGELDLTKRSCRIGMKICDLNYQGKGFGKDSLLSFMRFLFEKFQLKKIEIDCLADNIRAYSLYKKVGFRELETKKGFWIDPEGVSRDALFLEISKHEFN